MKYSIIDTDKGMGCGLNPKHHVLSPDGKKMVVNENELRPINMDIEKAAHELGGRILLPGEVENELKKQARK